MRNIEHPEKKEDEIFLTNATYDEYRHIGWKSKRKGHIAYDIFGDRLNFVFPVFVNKQEYEDKMKRKT